MRPRVIASMLSIASLCIPSAASAQDLLASDRAALRAEPGVLVHPTLGFRVRDVGLSPDDVAISHPLAQDAGGANRLHGWSYARGDDSVRIVLAASGAPRASSREMVRNGVARFASFGAVAVERSDEGGSSSATLRLGPRTVILRAFPFRDGARGLVLMVSVVHLDGALARTIAESLDVPAPQPEVTVLSGLGREVIRGTIRAWIADVRQCYESALATRPMLEGRVTASFIIRATGTVQTAAVSATTLHDDEVERCIVDVVRSIRFPAPAGGGLVGVNYPFVLRSGE